VEFSIRALAPATARTGCLVLGVFKNEVDTALTRAAQLADRAAGGAIRAALAQGDLSANPGSTLLLRRLPGLAAERVLLVGLGERKDFGEQAFRDAVGAAAKTLRETGARDATLFIADLKVGDTVHYAGATARVCHMRFYPGFRDLLAHEDWRKIDPDAANREGVLQILEAGHEETVRETGAVAIELEPA